MSARMTLAEKVARSWPQGECHFCHAHGEQVDGDRISWLGRLRSVCNRPACVRDFYAVVDRAEVAERSARRKRTPAEIHELKMEELRERRRARKGGAR